MLDINLFRVEKGGDPEVVRESQRRRFADVGLVDQVLELDAAWRAARGALDTANMDFNALNQEIKKLRLAKEDSSEPMARSKTLKAAVKAAEEEEKRLAAARDAALLPIGNLVADGTPVSDDEANNVVARRVGTPRMPKAAAEGEKLGEKLYNHVDLVLLLGIADLEKGAEVAGSRGYYLKNEGVLLNQALINYALAWGCRRGYAPVQTPFFMQKGVMAECAQLAQFDEELYKVTGEGEEKYLIATAEQTLCALHRNTWLEPAALPLRYVGYSTCFRKEAGSHGRDTLGIFRVHQFEKVEQFVVASPAPGASDAELDAMLATAEGFYESLGLAFQVVDIVSGELNAAAARKYDVEAWFPASATYRELVSASNCTDYQARRLGVRVRSPTGVAAPAPGADGAAAAKKPAKEYAHMLNATLAATERTLCCVLENWQEAGGVRVPPALRPFMLGIEFIPFRKAFDAKGKLVDVPGAARGVAFPAGADGAASMSAA